MKSDKSFSLVIPTGLVDSISKSVLLNVIGQLSDGIWENSRAMTHYWPYVDVEYREDIGQVCLVISLSDNSTFYGGHGYNYFINPYKLNKDSVRIKKWFADKIKAIVRQESKDYPKRGIKFNVKCTLPLDYMYHYDDSSIRITVADAYRVSCMLSDKALCV